MTATSVLAFVVPFAAITLIWAIVVKRDLRRSLFSSRPFPTKHWMERLDVDLSSCAPWARPQKDLLDERFRLLTERCLRPLTQAEADSLRRLDEQLEAIDVRDGHNSDDGERAGRLDASLDRLEQYIGTLKTHAK